MASMALRIRQARIRAGLTQSELARRVSVQRSAVTQWEKDDGTHPSVDHLAKIACETGYYFEWLATGRGSSHFDGQLEPEALLIEDIARDEVESRALIALRRLKRKREPMVRLLELLSS